MYETCACVITLFYSATCALILSVISHWCLRGVHVLREALVVSAPRETQCWHPIGDNKKIVSHLSQVTNDAKVLIQH